MPITLPELPYAHEALEPLISSATLKLHHGAHHRGYVDKLNALVKDEAPLEAIMRRTVRRVTTAQRIVGAFGGQAQLLEQLKAAALAVFGSGWTWLVSDGGVLRVTSTTNADSPIAHGQQPLLALDVWEHAYYLDYQSRRAEYVAAVVHHLLNWEFAERNFAQEPAHA